MQADELIRLAEKRRKVLMVDHTFIYSGAVRKLREIIDSGDLGDIYYFDSVRVNLGLFQADVNVVLEDNVIAHFHLNWLSPVKMRRTLIGGSRKMVIYDPSDPENQVKVFDKGIDLRQD